MAEIVPLPAGYTFEQLSRRQIPELIAKVKQWHPDISVGAGSCYLREQFYLDKVFLTDGPERDIYVQLIKFAGELVGMWSYEREIDALSIYGRLLIVAPQHRGSKVALHCMSGTESVSRACGAEFIYTMATLKVSHMQVALERAGYRLIGFVPGYDREVDKDGVVKRVFEGVYAKVLVPEAAMLRPDPSNLTPGARKLFELMFPPSVG
jgi:hypothetical protein